MGMAHDTGCELYQGYPEARCTCRERATGVAALNEAELRINTHVDKISGGAGTAMNDNAKHKITDAEYEAAIGEPPPPETEQQVRIERSIERVDARAGGGLEDFVASLTEDEQIIHVIPLDHGRAALIMERLVVETVPIVEELGDDG